MCIDNIYTQTGVIARLQWDTTGVLQMTHFDGNRWVLVDDYNNKANNNDLTLITNKINSTLPEILTSDLHYFNTRNNVYIVKWFENTTNTPYKAGITTASTGFAIVYALSSNYANILAMGTGDDRLFTQTFVGNTWFDWKSK